MAALGRAFAYRARLLAFWSVVLALFGIGRQLVRTRQAYRAYAVAEYGGSAPPAVVQPPYNAAPPRPVDGERFRIAVGGAMTSKGTNIERPDQVGALPVFWQLLPAFCRTASPLYEYHFYFGVDSGDVISGGRMAAAVGEAFRQAASRRCAGLSVGRLRLVTCPYEGEPARAQNDAMMAAYLDGMDFFYRINDDTIPTAANWTESFVRTLSAMSPPLVGVVGPRCARGPPDILAHDFVHRTHVDVFGFYYPRHFTDWYADTWITYVYKPDRSVKDADVVVEHTEMMGQRYSVHEQGLGAKDRALRLAAKYRDVIERYIEATFLPKARPDRRMLGRRVISMSLYGSNPRYVFGAVRNAQLMPVVYPWWQMRVYYHPRPETPSHQEHPDLYVDDNVLDTLRRLNVELIPVTDPVLLRRPSAWRYLVFDDDQNVEYALIRNADARISAREARLVDEWLSADVDHTVHCIRDHPIQGITPLMGGLWGGKGKNIRIAMKSNVTSLIYKLIQDGVTDVEALHRSNSLLVGIWIGTRDRIFCHDSVTCRLWNGSHPAPRLDGERDVYVGQRFDAFEDGLTLDERRYLVSPECDDDVIATGGLK